MKLLTMVFIFIGLIDHYSANKSFASESDLLPTKFPPFHSGYGSGDGVDALSGDYRTGATNYPQGIRGHGVVSGNGAIEMGGSLSARIENGGNELGGTDWTGVQNGVHGMEVGYGSELGDGGNGIEDGYTFGVDNGVQGMERGDGMGFGSGTKIQANINYDIVLGGETRLEGQWINANASLAFPMGENIFIVACVGCGGNYLKMVKIRVTSKSTFDWIEAKYQGGNYPTNCKSQKTFTVECFVGTSVDESKYSVVLVAKPQDLVMYDDPLTTKWCKKHKNIEGRNDCMDDKQCLENARRECDKNPDCFGVMWYSHLKRQPLQICLSRELEPKTDGWRTMLKSEVKGEWFIGEINSDCDATCAAHSLVCTENEMWNHNSDVDSPEKLAKLINRLQGTTSFSFCSGNYGDESDVPVFSTSERFCLSSSPGKSRKNIDCGRSPMPKEQYKERLCYCHAEENIHSRNTTRGDCKNGNAKLGSDGIPYLFWDEHWSPICGHWFWNNQEGAKAFCQELGFPGGKLKRTNTAYTEDAIAVGQCKSGEAISSCTGNYNHYKTTNECKAGQKAKITISCDGHTQGSEIDSCAENDPSKCLEDSGNGFVPDNDCIACTKSHRQKCADGYIMNSSPIMNHQCTKITCTKPVACPERCKTCKTGGSSDGGLPINSNGVCEHFCSKLGYCGIGNGYKTGDDCSGCNYSAPTTTPPITTTIPPMTTPSTSQTNGTGYWMTANGWCVNGNGKAVRGESKKGLTQDECFKYCEEDPSLSGCTYDYYNNCITYTGNVTGCNGHGAYKCHYRTETRPGCTCKDLINSHGQGNCQGSPSNIFGKQICYVNQPSTCPDARADGALHGEKFSAQACENDAEFTKDGYLVENGMSCEGNFYEKLLNETNVFDARDWCNKNPSCVGIYDLCGRKNTFSYCKKDDKVVPSKCGSTLYTKAKWACPKYDVGFILDGSGSVHANNWLKELKFTKEVAKLADINSGSRAAVISFASHPKLKIKFTDHHDYASFSNAVDHLPFKNGGTNIIRALQDGLDEMFVPTPGSLSDNIRLAFLITDGKDKNSMQKYIDMKENYKKHDIMLYVIAVGKAKNLAEDKLKVLDENFLHVTDFSKLEEIFHTRVGKNICKASNLVVPSCPTVKVTNADSADSNGQYEYLPAVRSPWAPDRPVYKRVNNTGGSHVRYVFWTEGKAHGWVIGGPTELMKSGSFFHQSKHQTKEPWQATWTNNEIVKCDNEICCEAQVATCLACKANKTLEDYCRLNPKTTGCPRETCNEHQCANGGTCVENNGVPKCNCPSGYVGNHCEIKNLCVGYQCSNGGTCNLTNGTPQCLCPIGYLGIHCQKKDLCFNYQCLNGGQCVEKNGLQECECPRQYHGCHCEQKDPCADYQCANGGTCIENNGSPTCNCPSGFSGSHCGEKDLCANYQCSNGGTCVENNERPTCNCPSGFSGSHCEKRDACTNYQCANGGACVESNGTAKCICLKGFSGEHCREKDALEGQRCSERSGPACAEGLQCIGKIQQVDGQGTCRNSSSNCPHGVPVVNCLIDPCQRKTCSDQQATCVSNYCGGCNAVFYDYSGQNHAKCLPNLFGCKGNQIALMDPHKKFLQILPSGEGIATSKTMANLKGSTFTFEDLGGDYFNSTLQSYTDRKVALKSVYGKYLVAYPGPNFDIKADGATSAGGGTFVLRHNDQTPKQYWFRTIWSITENGHKRPLYMWDTKGKLRGNADDVRRWEKFIPTCLDDGQLGSEAPTDDIQMWSPNTETVIRYKSNQLISSFGDILRFDGINDPNIVQMVADVKVQAFNDETLRVKFEHIKFYARHSEVSMTEAHQILCQAEARSGHSMHGAQVFKTFLEDPMVIFVKKGRAKNLLVSKNEPECVTQIKQELVNDLVGNGQPQNLQVVKKNAIINPLRVSTNAKKINLTMT